MPIALPPRSYINELLTRMEVQFKKHYRKEGRLDYLPLPSSKTCPTISLITGGLSVTKALFYRIAHKLTISDEKKVCVITPEEKGQEFIAGLLSTNLCADFSRGNSSWVQDGYLDLVGNRLGMIDKLDLSIIETSSMAEVVGEIPENLDYLLVSGFPFQEPQEDLAVLSELKNNVIAANTGNTSVKRHQLEDLIDCFYEMEEVAPLEYRLTICEQKQKASFILKLNSSEQWIEHLNKLN
jgi:hypothetical protein